ncbi:uncharacterized protein METZ01_LOCUS7565, partial [marine metagenome]
VPEPGNRGQERARSKQNLFAPHAPKLYFQGEVGGRWGGPE